MSVGVRTGVVGNAPLSMGASAANAEIVLGPNSIIDLPEGASFQFVEIQARSLAEHRAWLELLVHHGRPLKCQWLHHRHTPCCKAKRSRKHRCFLAFSPIGRPLLARAAKPLVIKWDQQLLLRWWLKYHQWLLLQNLLQQWLKCCSCKRRELLACRHCGNG